VTKAIFCQHAQGKALDIEGGVGGKRVLAWARHGGANQQWDLVPVAPASGTILVYGATAKLQHVQTGSRLHSHGAAYPAGSRQQQVTCFSGSDANDWWRVKPAHGEAQPPPSCDGGGGGGSVAEGAIVRLEHVETNRNLHSHDIRSPVTKQTEVSCFGNHGNGDSNCNWRVHYGQEGGALRLQPSWLYGRPGLLSAIGDPATKWLGVNWFQSKTSEGHHPGFGMGAGTK